MTIIDITPAVSARMPVFPGDTKYAAVRTLEISKDIPVNVSRIVMSTHTGAHADAPLHYHEDGDAIDQVRLEPYIGGCAVVQIMDAGSNVSQKALSDALLKTCGEDIPARVLIRTYERQPKSWDPDFTAVDAAAINWLGERGVVLVGVDTPSLDPEQSKTMNAHKAVYANDMRILEGLRLDGVAPGIYELIAPPLKLAGLDAAPVRAVLRTIP